MEPSKWPECLQANLYFDDKNGKREKKSFFFSFKKYYLVFLLKDFALELDWQHCELCLPRKKRSFMRWGKRRLLYFNSHLLKHTADGTALKVARIYLHFLCAFYFFRLIVLSIRLRKLYARVRWRTMDALLLRRERESSFCRENLFGTMKLMASTQNNSDRKRPIIVSNWQTEEKFPPHPDETYLF